MRFDKLHGCGNDFVLLNGFGPVGDPPPSSDWVRSRCDRRDGDGADGVIRVSTDPDADAAMQIWNADGGEAGMCGNGLRVVARWLHDTVRCADPERLRIRLGNRIHPVTVQRLGGRFQSATVGMGQPVFDPASIPVRAIGSAEAPVQLPIPFGDRSGSLHVLSMGNPHAVLFVDEITDRLVTELGPRLEVDPRFPERTNVGFARIVDRQTVELRVWERGVGETLACGSGACAAVVAGRAIDQLDDRVTVRLPGGELIVSVLGSGDLLLTGPAEWVVRRSGTVVFSGQVSSPI